uniref:Peptide toxin n=1 Tax=Cotesia flavipes TaxID=89805 RepID=A0A8K1YTP4_COTFL|nr:peptide toxin [Cotesia flavipes]
MIRKMLFPLLIYKKLLPIQLNQFRELVGIFAGFLDTEDFLLLRFLKKCKNKKFILPYFQ